jgi:hypothetical protein
MEGFCFRPNVYKRPPLETYPARPSITAHVTTSLRIVERWAKGPEQCRVGRFDCFDDDVV